MTTHTHIHTLDYAQIQSLLFLALDQCNATADGDLSLTLRTILALTNPTDIHVTFTPQMVQDTCPDLSDEQAQLVLAHVSSKLEELTTSDAIKDIFESATESLFPPSLYEVQNANSETILVEAIPDYMNTVAIQLGLTFTPSNASRHEVDINLPGDLDLLTQFATTYVQGTKNA